MASLLFAAAYALAPSWGASIAFFVVPAGTGVAFGAFLFGIGMQLANGCGSGTLAALGSGSIRMAIVLPAFIAGSFWGSLDTPFWDALPGLPPTMLGDGLGWPATLAIYAIVAAALWFALPGRTAALPRSLVVGAVLLAGLNFATLCAAGHLWGITWGFALAGAKVASALGWSPSPGGFWFDGWGQVSVLNSSVGKRLAQPSIVSGARNAQKPAHRLDIVFVAVRLNKPANLTGPPRARSIGHLPPHWLALPAELACPRNPGNSNTGYRLETPAQFVVPMPGQDLALDLVRPLVRVT